MSARLSPWMARGRAGTGLVLWMGILAVAAGLGIAGTAVVDAQDAPAVGIEVRVWQHVEDDGDLHISVRQKGGSWGTLGTIPLPLDDGFDPTTRYRYGDTALGVPLGGGISVTIEVRVWQHVESGRRFYIGARPAGGSWTTLGATRLHLDDGLSSRRIFRYGDIPVDVPLPVDPHLGACSNGIAVPEPERNPGLVSDCAVLLKARDILAGNHGILNWSADQPMGAWTGLTVAGTPERVQALELERDGLTGEIPPELGQLASLRVLWLPSNELTGRIPPELGQLSNLEELRLNRNELTGNIPAELGQLGNLKDLWLYENQLSGEIPPELGMLSSLESLERQDAARIRRTVEPEGAGTTRQQLDGRHPARACATSKLVQAGPAEQRSVGERPTGVCRTFHTPPSPPCSSAGTN